MSRLNDLLYFAPDVPFSKVDWDGRLPTQFQQRISGFYLKPALDLAVKKHSFASGVLVVCAIDTLAQFKTGTSGVTARITDFCRKISDLNENQNAIMFCEHFRHGLVHGARVKNGSEFDVEIKRIAIANHERLIVNPELLAKAVIAQLNDFVDSLYRNPGQKVAFCKKLKKKFQYERTH